MIDKTEAIGEAHANLAWKDFWRLNLKLFLLLSVIYIVGLLLFSHGFGKGMLQEALLAFVTCMTSRVLSAFLVLPICFLSPSRRQRCPSCGMTSEEKFKSGTECSQCAQRMEPGPHLHALWDWIDVSIGPLIFLALLYDGTLYVSLQHALEGGVWENLKLAYNESLPKNLGDDLVPCFGVWLVWSWFSYRSTMRRYARVHYCENCGYLLLPESLDDRSFEETKASGMGLCRLCREGAIAPMIWDSGDRQRS